MKYLQLIFESASRNLARTVLTSLGTMILVFVVTLVWSLLFLLQQATSERASNVKAIVTERWSIPSQMPISYSDGLSVGGATKPDDIRPTDSMSWTFVGGSIEPDKAKRNFSNLIFSFCMKPEKLLTMMDQLDELRGEAKSEFQKTVDKLKENRQGIILGVDNLKKLNKKVGERFILYGLNYKNIDLELEVVGTFPPGRYDQSAAINIEYFQNLLEQYPSKNKGVKHPQADKSLNLMWLKVPDTKAYAKMADQIERATTFTSPEVKVETSSSGIATFLAGYKDLLFLMEWLLAPAILITLSLIIANAISISVRERRMEFAVMKVLGFRPWQIMILVLGEALLIGTLAGIASAGITYMFVNWYLGGIRFPIAFFGEFFIPERAILWGFLVGAGTAVFGSLVPAWNACRVKVSEVFAKVT